MMITSAFLWLFERLFFDIDRCRVVRNDSIFLNVIYFFWISQTFTNWLQLENWSFSMIILFHPFFLVKTFYYFVVLFFYSLFLQLFMPIFDLLWTKLTCVEGRLLAFLLLLRASFDHFIFFTLNVFYEFSSFHVFLKR